MRLKFGNKEWFLFIISILLLTDLSILLDIPFYRQIFGFFFLTILPGILILHILKLNKIESTEKVVLSVGLSISFLMIYGIILNYLYFSLGYFTPLSTISLLISFNIAFIVLLIIGSKINENLVFSIPNLVLSAPEKSFLILPVFFPTLSIVGTYVMKTEDNNIILMLLLFLISIYIFFMFFLNKKFPKRLYPIVILLITFSLLLISMLRFPHIYGHDVHTEYGIFFQTTFESLYWRNFAHSILDSALSISLLPTIFQSILYMNSVEFLFKGIYVIISSFSPLIIYILAKKYVDESYAFLASFFFVSQSSFLAAAGNPRTNVAIFFVALAIMVLFNDKINLEKKKILFIIFSMALVLSHYSTTYLFFFVLFFCWFLAEILSKRYTFDRIITPASILLLVTFIFFWYSQLTETAFNGGVNFIEKALSELNRLFFEDSRSPQINQLFGQDLAYPILSKVNLIVTWSTFILIGTGIVTIIIRLKDTINISKVKFKKSNIFKTKIEMEYIIMIIISLGLLVLMIVLPFVSIGYGIDRLFSFALVFISVCFVIGGMAISQYFTFFVNGKYILKDNEIEPLYSRTMEHSTAKLSEVAIMACNNRSAYYIILLILIPYFLFITGAAYQIFGVPVSINLNSEGEAIDREFVHDMESFSAKWLNMNAIEYPQLKIYVTDYFAGLGLISQGKISSGSIDTSSFALNKISRQEYLYLNYNNIVKGKFVFENRPRNLSEFSDIFKAKNKIYNNGGSEVWS